MVRDGVKIRIVLELGLLVRVVRQPRGIVNKPGPHLQLRLGLQSGVGLRSGVGLGLGFG